MATSSTNYSATFLTPIPFTTATTQTSTRELSNVETANGTNLSIIKVRAAYQRRRIEAEKKFLFFMAEMPAYFPRVGQKVLIHHLDVPASGALDSFFTSKSTNVAVGTFVQFGIMSNTTASEPQRDGFRLVMELSYDDDTLGYISGDCNGTIEYDTSPLAYDILKPVESTVIVTERVPYDNYEGDNYLHGTTTGATDDNFYVAPMLFINRGDSNTVFANLYKSFNLPITTDELSEFTQTDLGYWTNSISGDLYHDGMRGYWTSGGTQTMVHPVTGYTGMFYDTVYQHLAYSGISRTLVDRILVMEIPQSMYGEIIDGKSLCVRVPKADPTTFYEIYGAYKKNSDEYALGKMDNYMSEHDLTASYFGVPTSLNNTGITSTYESNVVLLFCDDRYAPSSGNTVASWATGHAEVLQGEKVYNSTAATKKAFFDFYEDTCVGIAYLDRGFVVITDPVIVDAVYTHYGTGVTHTNIETEQNIIMNLETGTSDIDWFNSQFLFTTSFITGTTHFAEFLSYNVEKSMNIVCLASANEFFRTTNSTAKELVNATSDDYAEFKNPISGDLHPIIITELGLHDAAGNLLAIVKPFEPIKKYWFDVVSANIKIRL